TPGSAVRALAENCTDCRGAAGYARCRLSISLAGPSPAAGLRQPPSRGRGSGLSMPLSDRSLELIQKYLEALASASELAELEGLLAADPEVANAFAEAARLEAGLHDYFGKQYKIQQVAA